MEGTVHSIPSTRNTIQNYSFLDRVVVIPDLHALKSKDEIVIPSPTPSRVSKAKMLTILKLIRRAGTRWRGSEGSRHHEKYIVGVTSNRD